MLHPFIPSTRVDVHAIERDLTMLWKRAAGEAGAGGDAVMRACVLNLIACAPNPTASERMSAVVGDLAVSHPSRCFMITTAPRASQAALDVWVQAQCSVPAPGRQQVCCEQIRIDAHGAATARVASIVRSLLVADVPTVLWWPGRAPFLSGLFTRLHGLADRVLVDSAGFVEPDQDLPRLAALLGQRVPVSDLNWARLTPWRELIVQFFDATPLQAYLGQIERVVIRHAVRAGGLPRRSQALLLAGWLTSRLGWMQAPVPAVLEDDTICLQLHQPGAGTNHAVAIELRADSSAGEEHEALLGITLVARGDVARFTVERSADPAIAHTVVERAGGTLISRMARMAHVSEATLIAEELRVLGHAEVYVDALGQAAELARRIMDAQGYAA